MSHLVILNLSFGKVAVSLRRHADPATSGPTGPAALRPVPSDVEPTALAAMRRPMLGRLDPAFHAVRDEGGVRGPSLKERPRCPIDRPDRRLSHPGRLVSSAPPGTPRCGRRSGERDSVGRGLSSAGSPTPGDKD
jgi:hypothetical protein